MVSEGQPNTDSFKLFAQDSERNQRVSAWHDIPLLSEEGGTGAFNLVVEIPRFTKAKMEIDTKTPLNPIVQDKKKGVLRDYHGPIFWNYGALPQTWEDPNVKGGPEVFSCFGDNDPLDVVEIGSQSLQMGTTCAIKPLGILAMIDGGELDWKVIAISLSDPLASEISDVHDIEEAFPHTLSGIREWFRWYKTPDGKPLNDFGFDGAVQNSAYARDVILHTHEAWKELRAGKRDPGTLW
eukprot:CAMPEP_0184485140 /NCGR_PEP_ID=MMETSP0113_2-20130426/6787_1 /TAXON_ID=91329 /ORGANISM="Norrisiella sphaerica, Strain BC52" /LENGTH=237 /DNA_ID=CAMNT_0026866459 /DNA_START=173 /DNA_END=883 /DNA_ORIENTATION=+